MVKSSPKKDQPEQRRESPEQIFKVMLNALLAEQQKSLAVCLADMTLAIKAASVSLEEAGREDMAQLTRGTAEGLEHCSSGVLKMDAEDVVQRLRDITERYPWLYIGGMALAGALLAHRITIQSGGGDDIPSGT